MSHPAAFSFALRELLHGDRVPLQVFAAFPSAVYVEVVGRDPILAPSVLSVVAPTGLPHPNSVVLSGPSTPVVSGSVVPRSWGVGTTGQVGGGELRIGSIRVVVARWWDPRPTLGVIEAPALAVGLAELEELLAPELVADAHDLTGRAAALVDALVAEDLAAAVTCGRGLIGLGPGLTPSGDDVLCGLFAAAVSLAGSPDPSVAGVGLRLAELARDRTTKLSAALLWHALRGQAAGPVAGVLRALAPSSVGTAAAGSAALRSAALGSAALGSARGGRALPDRLAALLGVGSTSGRDLAIGLCAGARLALASRTAEAATGWHDLPAALSPAALSPSLVPASWSRSS